MAVATIDRLTVENDATTDSGPEREHNDAVMNLTTAHPEFPVGRRTRIVGEGNEFVIAGLL